MKVKLKGEYAACGPGLPGASGLKKNPNMEVCTEAVVKFLTEGTPIEETIEWCPDVRKFVVVRRVTGGAKKDDLYLGKALRWYYSKHEHGGFQRADNGNSVPETIGAKLMMELVDGVPADIDYDYYVREAYAILQDIGMQVVDPRLIGRTGLIYARLPDAKGFHLVDAATGIAICGKERASIRDSWHEFEGMPQGMRFCPKCKRANDL